MLADSKGIIMQPNRLYSTLVFVSGFAILSTAAGAEQPQWIPAVGTLTPFQDTDVRLISQEWVADELQQVKLGDVKVWTLEVKARYGLKNTSKAKKKPTILFPICRTSAGSVDNQSCELKKTAVRLTVDGRRITPTVTKQNDIVYLRFSTKFGPKAKHEVEVSYRHFENHHGWGLDEADRPFAQFDYRLASGDLWQGEVGMTRARIRVPFKADRFNTRILSARGKVERDTAFVDWRTKPFEPEPNEMFSFIVITPGFKYKTDMLKKKLDRTPKNAARRLAMARLIAPYTPAVKQLTEHLVVALKKKLKKPNRAEARPIAGSFAKLVTTPYRSSEDADICDPRFCEYRAAFQTVIPLYCRSDDACRSELTATIEKCCGNASATPGEAAAPTAPTATPEPTPAPQATPPAADDTADGNTTSELEKQAFLALIAFIALVWVIAGIAIALTLRRHRRAQNAGRK